MKALVLTFDKYKPFAAHMIQCYEDIWPNNPFTFRVPYQNDDVKLFFESKFGNKVEMIKSPSGIVDTMFSLCEDLDDKEWVYWCMDDRYPYRIDLNEVNACFNILNSSIGDKISGLMYCNNYNIWLPKNNFGSEYRINTPNGQTYIRRKNYTMIWNHQFLRVNVVRTFFNLFPRVMKQAKEMDYIKDRSVLPDTQRLYMLDHNAAVFGESTNRGIITKNCAESFLAKGWELPTGFKVSDQVLMKGTEKNWQIKFFLLKHFIKGLISK